MAVYYLEYIAPTEHHHKFYELIVEQQTVKIRFGRIGTEGTQQIKDYPSSEIAQREAEKKLKEKQKKGYQLKVNLPAIEESINPSTVTAPSDKTAPKNLDPPLALRSVKKSKSTPQSKSIPKSKSHPKSKSNSLINKETIITPLAAITFPSDPFVAPLRWQFASGFSSFGLAVERDYCWLGNEKGRVLKFDDQGNILEQYQLPRAVKSIVTDDLWVYVGCDNGVIYDMTGKIPYVAYEIESAADIFGLSITDGILGVSDVQGGLSKIDPEGEILWQRLSSGKQGWMICSDAQGFYHGHSKGLTFYELEQGRQLWHQATVGKVLFGCQTDECLYVATSGKQVQCFSKTGQLIASYLCDASVYCCAVDQVEKRLFAADSSGFIYGFNRQGQRRWKASTGCGAVLSMQLASQGKQQLYLATSQGILACMEVSDQALWGAVKGQFPDRLQVENTLAMIAAPPQDLEKIHQGTEGILLECFRQGQRLRVRVLSPGYHTDWMVQFPRNLRQEGDRYLVETLHESSQGFYRIQGDIKRLV